MAEDGKEIQPIIKKIKKGGHGHHGGAWKVAYADFVTAMMAFFLLLWLLSSTTDEQKKGIADYFTPTVGIAGEQGVGTQGGVSSVEGTRKDELSPPGIVFGAPPTGPIVQNPESTEAEDQAEEEKRMEELAEQIKKGLIEDKEFGQFKQNLLVEQTPEGLRIQIVDQENRSMFEKGSYVLADYAKVILEKLSPILMRMPNRLAIAGHTDAAKYGISTSYTNWELSADRANATRRFLLTTKMPETKIAIVSGRADTEPLIVQDRLSPGNRRMSITLLYRHIAPYEVPATDELLRPPGSKPDGPTPNIRIPTE